MQKKKEDCKVFFFSKWINKIWSWKMTTLSFFCLFVLTFLLWKLKEGTIMNKTTLSCQTSTTPRWKGHAATDWFVLRREDVGWDGMKGWSDERVKIMNDPAFFFLSPKHVNSRCDECSVKKGEHATCVLLMFTGLYPFGFLQTGVKGSFTCMCVNVSVCLCVCVCVFRLVRVKCMERTWQCG